MLLLVGSLGYEPNRFAAYELAQEILPLVRRSLPHAHALIVGTDPGNRIRRELGALPGVTVTGEVPDIRPFLDRATMTVLPLRSGGGTRLKLLESFAARLPVVTTAKGAEGLSIHDGEHLLVADSPTKMAQAVQNIAENPQLRHRLAEAALDLLRNQHSTSICELAVGHATADLMSGRRTTKRPST